MLRRAVWIWSLTICFAVAGAVALFLRELAHSGIGDDPAEFIARANTELIQMVVIEAIVYVAAGVVVMWRMKKP